MTYEEARAYLQTAGKQGMVLGLDSMKALLKRLGNPEEALRFLHIAGTNGKGSVLAFCASVLKACGYRTGAYTSPAVFAYEERFAIDGEPMERERLPYYVEIVKEAAEALAKEGIFPTVFEQETAMAFLYFKEEHCDLVLLETGLGGSEDATNVVKTTAVSVITSVALDHTAVLGDTLEEIAACKAGILKVGVPVVYGVTDPKAKEVMEERAEALCCPKYPVDYGSFRISEQPQKLSDGRLAQTFAYKQYEDLEITLLGRYQPKNAAVAVEALEALKKQGYEIPEEKLREGLREAAWLGRFELMQQRPAVILDGAHNPDGVRALIETVQFYFSGRKLYGIMGVLADKDYKEMVQMIVPLFTHMYTITPDSPRALSAEKLQEVIIAAAESKRADRTVMKSVQATDGVPAAIEAALEKAGEQDVVLIFGSLSFLGEAKEALAQRKG